MEDFIFLIEGICSEIASGYVTTTKKSFLLFIIRPIAEVL